MCRIGFVATVMLLAGVTQGGVIWKDKVVDVGEAALLLEKVSAGDALVIESIVSGDQVAGLTNVFPKISSLQLKKDARGYPVLDMNDKDWCESTFPIADRANCLAMRRHGRGLVVVTRERGHGRKGFEANLEKEIAFQNLGLVYCGCRFDCKDGGSGRGLMRGRGHVELVLKNDTGTNVEIEVELRLKDAEGHEFVHRGSGATAKEGRFSAYVSGPFLGHGEMNATLSLTEKKSGRKVVVQDWDIHWPKYFTLKMPDYRGLVSVARRSAAIRLAATFSNYYRESLVGRPLEVTVTGPDGQEVAKMSRVFNSSPTLEFEVPLKADAAPGTYAVRAETCSEDGAAVVAEDIFKVVPVRPGQVFVDQDGGLLADGKPWFPFGLYHVFSTNDYEMVASLGVDLIQTWNVTEDSLSWLERKGIRIAYETSAWPQVVNNWKAWRGVVPERINFETNTLFRKEAELVKNHPNALAFWYTADEASIGEIAGVNRIHAYWRTLDPEDHPTYIVTTGDARMAEAGEVLGFDNYPRSFGAKRPMTLVSDGIEVIYRDSPAGRCVIMVPESFGTSDKHKETPDELKCMAYLAMVHGAKGIFWYCWTDGIGQGAHCDANTRQAIKETIEEAKGFKYALLAPGFVRLSSTDRRVHACLCGDATTGRYLIAVNGTDEPSDGVIESAALKGLTLEPINGSPKVQPSADGRFAVPLAGTKRAVWRVCDGLPQQPGGVLR